MLWKASLLVSALFVIFSEGKPLDEDVPISLDVKGVFPKEHLPKFLDTLRDIQTKEGIVVNDKIDEVLTNINQLVVDEGMDPAKLEDHGFEFNVLLISATMKVTHGWLQGMSTISRLGNAVISSDGETLILALSATFKKLTFTYDYVAQLIGFGPQGGIDGEVTNLAFTINISINPIDMKAKLKDFELTDQGNMKIKFNGNDLIDLVLNVLTKGFTLLFFPILRIFVSNYVEKLIIEMIDLHNAAIGTYIY